MKTEYIIKHKTKTRIYFTKYYLSGFKKSEIETNGRIKT